MMELRSKIRFYDNRFWLLTISGLLIAFNWCLFKYHSVYFIYWCAALFVTWHRRNDLDLESDIFSTIIGLILIVWLLFRGVIMMTDSQTDIITRMYPLFSMTGIFLVSTKVSKIVQYWREILIVSFTGIPWEHIYFFPILAQRISIFDAKISQLMLCYVGFDAYQKDNLLILPTGSIKIAGPCSSFDLLALLWQCCLFICLCFAISKNQKLLLWLWSTVIALSINGIRLCLMALLIANDQQDAFDYWHSSAGAKIFTTIAILLFTLVYWLLVERKTEVLIST